MSVNPQRKAIFKKDGRTISHFEYPEDYTLQQRGITTSGGYYSGGFFGTNTKSKGHRIASPAEVKSVAAAKNDVGHKTQKQYSTIAQRRVPKALHSMYGLPMRDKKRTVAEQKQFMKSLNKR